MAVVAVLAAAHYRAQQIRNRRLAAALLALWALVDSGDIAASWEAVIDRAAGLVALGQYSAAAEAMAYIREAALAQGVDAVATAAVDARAFAGVAADGRMIVSMLERASIYARAGIGMGMPIPQAMARGAAFLALAGPNEATQAGINADHAAITVTPMLHGYVRMLVPPSCSRCVQLAGRFYRWNDGFLRHPHCDCRHVPAADAAGVKDVRTSPRGYFDSLTTAEQDATFGKHDAQAIRDGADISQVVNAHRGMTKWDSSTTTEGANVTRGRYGKAAGERSGQTDQFQRRQRGLYPKPDMHELSDVKRLTVAHIYELAGDNRGLAVELLGRYGYIT